MIKTLFLKVVNMSITASVVILAVLLIRWLFRKQPKIYSYLLWGMVLFRLLCPYSISLDTSLFNALPARTNSGQIEYIKPDIVYSPQVDAEIQPEVTTDIPAYTIREESDFVPQENIIVNAPKAEIDVVGIISVLWLFGGIYLMLNNLVSLVDIRKLLADSVYLEENIYINSNISTAFIMGLFKPEIYLPDNLDAEQAKYVLLHEQTHIRRGDYLFKVLGFMAVAVHWFNPLVWLAFHLAESDMEMSCDEAVIRKLGNSEKGGYSQTLLTISMPQGYQTAMHLAFGEGDTKARILNVLDYKKPAFKYVVCIAAVSLLAVTGLMFNPKGPTVFSVANLEANVYDQSIILRNNQYRDITDDGINSVYSALKKIEISESADEEYTNKAGYSYIKLKGNEQECTINFDENYEKMWVTSNAEEQYLVYNVGNPKKVFKFFSDNLSSSGKEKPVTQITFPAAVGNNTADADYFKNTAPFTVNMELPDNWYITDKTINPYLHSVQNIHNVVAIYNESKEHVGSIGYSVYSTDSSAPQDVYMENATYSGELLTLTDRYTTVSSHDWGETATTVINFNYNETNNAIVAFNKNLKCLIVMEFATDFVNETVLKNIAASIEIIPDTDNSMAKIRTEETQRLIEVAYPSKTEKNSGLTLGTAEIIQAGENGLAVEKLTVEYVNGIATNETVIETTVLREPVPEIQSMGILWNGTVINGGTGKLVWPTAAGYVSRGFVGQYPSHNGVDISAPEGTAIYAADNGVVTKALYTNTGYGIYCIIEHGGYQTVYAHCSELAVQVGQEVQQGQVIAYVGSSGNSTGNHLHFEVKKGNERVNPYSWF